MHAPTHESERVHEDAHRQDAQGAEQNGLLKALPPETYARLLPELEPLQLAAKQVLWEPNAPIRSLYFPRTAVFSLIIPLEEEPPVEAATVGCEGVVGVPVLLGATSTSARALTQVPGTAVRLSASALRAVLADDGALRGLMLRYTQALWEQTAQSVACNRRHAIEERCARWLLMTHDRVGSDTFPLTQGFLAAMLGVRRAGVTVAAGMLQQAGLIRYTRGRMTIVDRARLEEAACECYRSVKEKYDRLLGEPTS